MATEGITVQAGFQEASQAGKLYVMMHNATQEERKVSRGDLVCQGLTIPIPRVQLKKGVLRRIDHLPAKVGDKAS